MAAESAVLLALLVVVLCGTAAAFLRHERHEVDVQKTFDATPARIVGSSGR